MKASVRIRPNNPNHHLWNNNGTWWFHFSVHFPDYTAHRKRLNLKTRDVNVARFLRESLLHEYGVPPVTANQRLTLEGRTA